jgi:hypothetical protein
MIRAALIDAGILRPATGELRRVSLPIGLPLDAAGRDAARRHAIHGEYGRRVMEAPGDQVTQLLAKKRRHRR